MACGIINAMVNTDINTLAWFGQHTLIRLLLFSIGFHGYLTTIHSPARKLAYHNTDALLFYVIRPHVIIPH